jgi:glucokinase
MILAADIGGTKIAAALVDADGDLASPVQQVATPAAEGAEPVLAATVRLLRSLDRPDVDLIAVSSAGVVDAERGTVVAATASIAGWAGTAIADELGDRLGRPVQVLGDGHAFGVGEARYGAGRGHDSLLLLAVGTGVGGSYQERGRPLLGAHHVAGHFGHVAVPQAVGMLCPCGRTGHLEAIGSGAAILGWYHANGGDAEVTTTQQLFSRADDLAEQAIQLGARAVGVGAAGLANALDPGIVVVAGGLAQAGPRWEGPLREAFAEQLLPALSQLPLSVSSAGTSMALRGAAAYATERHQR